MSDNETPAGDTRKCPHCAEWIKAEAVVCRYCGRDVTPTVTADAEPQATSESGTPEDTSTGKRKKLWPLLFLIVSGVLAAVIGTTLLLTYLQSPKPQEPEPVNCEALAIRIAEGEAEFLAVRGDGATVDTVQELTDIENRVKGLTAMYRGAGC